MIVATCNAWHCIRPVQNNASEEGLMKRLIPFLVIIAFVWFLDAWWINGRQPEVSTQLALRQMDGLNSDAARLRTFEAVKDGAHVLAGMITVLAVLLCFGKEIR